MPVTRRVADFAALRGLLLFTTGDADDVRFAVFTAASDVDDAVVVAVAAAAAAVDDVADHTRTAIYISIDLAAAALTSRGM